MKKLIIILILIIPLSVQAVTNYDSDKDGLSNIEEKNIYYTDPYNADTDGDGHEDGLEIDNNYSPRHGEKRLIEVDSDQDYLNDYWELVLGTDLMNPDSDNDLYLDGTEVAASYNPLSLETEKLEKLIKVNIAKQELEYFFANKKLGSFLISSGIEGLDTPKGEYNILAKEPVKHYGGWNFDYPNTKWNLHFLTQKLKFYIHGAYWHNNFGNVMSHGCVNVDYKDMEPLYWFSQLGTKILIE